MSEQDKPVPITLHIEVVSRQTIDIDFDHLSWGDAWRHREQLAAPYIPAGFVVARYSMDGRAPADSSDPSQALRTEPSEAKASND